MTSALPRANTVILIGQLKTSVIAKESLALSIETADGVVNSILVVSAPHEMLANPLPEGVTIQVSGFLLPAGSKQQVVVSRERGHEVRVLGQVQSSAETGVATESPVSSPARGNPQPVVAEPVVGAPQPLAPQAAPSRSLGLRGLAAGNRSASPPATPKQPAQADPSPSSSSGSKPKGLSKLARAQVTVRSEVNDEPADFPGDSHVPPISAYEESYQQPSAQPASISPGFGRRNAPTFAPSDRDLDIPW